MNYFVIILILTGAFCPSTQSPASSELHYFFGCFESTEAVVGVTLNGDEFYYFDLEKKEIVWTVPNFPPAKHVKYAYEYAIRHQRTCKRDMAIGKSSEPNVPKAKDAPESSIYARDEAEMGVNNTLICFVNHFYPPSIKVKWTKNDVEVEGGASVYRYYPNRDGTFHQFFTLTFTPEEGDVYACTVEHTALENPLTRFWEPKPPEKPSVGPEVFCGVGLTLGLLGVAAGTFLLVKQPQ